MPATSSPNREIRPRVGFTESRIRRNSVVFPAPDGPVRNWNERAAIENERVAQTSGPMP
jgi:hypothetical protein